jgi:TolB-like protein
VSIDDTKLPMPFDQIQCASLAGWTGDVNAPDWRKVLANVAALTGGPGVVPAQSAAAVRKTSICVLPFLNMSGDAEQEYFSDGMSEDIITDLSKVSALFVVARNTALTFKAKHVDVVQVARQLKVGHVLEGSVRKAGGRVRITAQLLDGATGGHVWAERYDRDLNDIFALQDEISQAIMTALKVKLLPEEKQRIQRQGTHDLAAYDLYLRGTRPAFGPDEQLARIGLLEAAVKLAPDYADAWSMLAYTRALWIFYRPFRERADVAEVVSAEAERALALDPNNFAAVNAKYLLIPPYERFVEGQALSARIEEIARLDGCAPYWRCTHLLAVGRNRDAVEVAQRGYELDPLDPFVANTLGFSLYAQGRYAAARQVLEDSLARWPDDHFTAMLLIIICAFTQDAARVEALLAPDRLARFPLREFEGLARSHAAALRDPLRASRRPIENARKRFEATGHADFGQLQMVAKLGAVDEAYAIAENAKFGPAGNDRDLMGQDAYRPSYLFRSMFPELRRDPRFVRLCARLGLVDYWLTTQHWPDCVDEVAPYYDFEAECRKVTAGPPLPPVKAAWATPAA